MTPAFYNSISTQRLTRSAARLLTAQRNEPIGKGVNPKNEPFKPHFAFDSLYRTWAQIELL